MKRNFKKLMALSTAFALVFGMFQVAAASADGTAPSTGSEYTKTYNFDSAEELKDFDSYYWSKKEDVVIKDDSVLDSFKLENGVITNTRPWDVAHDDGKLSNITSLTFKNSSIYNFDLSFRLKEPTDGSYGKRFFVGYRERIVGQYGYSNDTYSDMWDTHGNIHPFVSIREDNWINVMGNWIDSPVLPSSTDFSDYRIKVVGDKLSIWIDGQIVAENYVVKSPDERYDYNDTKAGYLSVSFNNSPGSIDNYSLTKLDEAGNPVPLNTSSKYWFFADKIAMKDVNHSKFKDFRTSSWKAEDGYKTYSYINSSLFNTGDYELASSSAVNLNGTDADCNYALTYKETLRNFEATVSMSFASEVHHGCAILNGREQEAGKAYRNMFTDDDKWPAKGKLANGTDTAAVSVNKNIMKVGSGAHTIKYRVVGDFVTYSIDGGEENTQTYERLAQEGFFSIIAANAKINLMELEIKWLDEYGDEADWGTGYSSLTSPEYKFYSNARPEAAFSDFRSSFWNKETGYTAYPTVNLDHWKIGEWGSAETKTPVVGGIGLDNMAALTLKKANIRDFELNLSFQQNNPNGMAMISLREKTAGQPIHHIGAWEWGQQPDGSKNPLIYIHFDKKNQLMYTDGVKTEMITDQFKTSGANNVRIVAVGNMLTVYCNGDELGKTIEISPECNESGYISYVACNTAAPLHSFKLDILDEYGDKINYAENSYTEIFTAEDLQKLGAVNGTSLRGNIALNTDIDFSAVDTSYFDFNVFGNKIDGKGHTVSNITEGRGLFKTLGDGAAVMNLKISGVNIPKSNWFDAAVANTSTGKDVLISNVAVENAFIKGGGVSTFVSNAPSGKITIENSYFNGEVIADYLGYFIGTGDAEKVIKNSVVSGHIVDYSGMYKLTDGKAAATENAILAANGNAVRKTVAELGMDENIWVHDGMILRSRLTGAKEFIKGDVNGDGNVNIIDLVSVKKNTVDSEYGIAYVSANLYAEDNDSNGAVINAQDITALKKVLIG